MKYSSLRQEFVSEIEDIPHVAGAGNHRPAEPVAQGKKLTKIPARTVSDVTRPCPDIGDAVRGQVDVTADEVWAVRGSMFGVPCCEIEP